MLRAMRALGIFLAAAAVTFASPAGAARIVDRGDLAIDIDATGAKVCHYNDKGPVDASACTPQERVTLSNLQMLQPNAFAGLVLHFRAWQASIIVTRNAPLHSMTEGRIPEDLAAYARGMRHHMVGTSIQITEAPRLVRARNGLQVIVSAVRNPTQSFVTRTLEVRARNATYRVLFSVDERHAAEIRALSDRAIRSVVARPARTFAEDRR
jgi:hypothetical protein